MIRSEVTNAAKTGLLHSCRKATVKTNRWEVAYIYMGEGESVWGEWGTNRWADYREIYIVCSDCHRVQTLRKEELFAMMQQILLDATSYCNTTEMLWSSLCSFHCFQLCRMNFSSVVDAVTVCMLCLKIARVGCRDFSL